MILVSLTLFPRQYIYYVSLIVVISCIDGASWPEGSNFIEYTYRYYTPPISLVNTQIYVAKIKTFQLNN